MADQQPQEGDVTQKWGVVDYDGNLLSGRWDSKEDAVKFGVCGKYLLSGSHAILVPEPNADTEPVITPYVPGESDATAPLRPAKKTRRLPKPKKKRRRKRGDSRRGKRQ